MTTLDVVGLVELADLLGAERATVRQWYHRGKLPPPDAVLAATPVWRLSTIERWRA
jgi:predicted DNA-binding transcriptional regulator AlpA